MLPLLPVNNVSSSNNGTNGNNGSKQEIDPNEDLFAIDYICFTAETRSLCLAGASSQVCVLRFNKHEVSTEVAVSDLKVELYTKNNQIFLFFRWW